jgi:ribonuclease VapC
MVPNVSTMDEHRCGWIRLDPDCPDLAGTELEAEDLVEAGVPAELARRLTKLVLRRADEADAVGIGAPTLTEVSLVLGSRLDRDPTPLLGRLLQEFAIVVVPFSEQHWAQATDAFMRLGRGRHPAALNFAGCLTYAGASLSDQPLLAMGDDFPQTDLELVSLT